MKRVLYLAVVSMFVMATNVQADLGPWKCGAEGGNPWDPNYSDAVMAQIEVINGDSTLRIYPGDPLQTPYMRNFGEMMSAVGKTDAPWDDEAAHIHTVVIEEGVASVGMRACYSMSNLERLYIPRSVEEIGADILFYDFNKALSIYCTGDTAIRVLSGGNYSPTSIRPYHHSAKVYVPHLEAYNSMRDETRSDIVWWYNFDNVLITDIVVPKPAVDQATASDTKVSIKVPLFGDTDPERNLVRYKVQINNVIDPTDRHDFNVQFSVTADKWVIINTNDAGGNAPRRLPSLKRDTVSRTTESLQIDITNLQPSSSYNYDVIATNSMDEQVGQVSGAFHTPAYSAPMDAAATEGGKKKDVNGKIVHNGQLYIIREGKTYDLRGGIVVLE